MGDSSRGLYLETEEQVQASLGDLLRTILKQ